MKRLFNRSGLIVLMTVMVASLGVSYAGYTAILESKIDLSTGSMDFQFCDSDELYSIQIQNGRRGEPMELDADINYDGKTLKISTIEAIDVSLLREGNLRFIIRYGIKPSGDSSILRSAIHGKDCGCEYISLTRSTRTAQWVIRGCEDDLGCDGKAAGTVSGEIDKLLPDSLGDFQIVESYIIDGNEEYLEGVITLEQIDVPDWISSAPVLLSQLGLSEKTMDEIVDEDNLTISLSGFYHFEIPLDLDQFNAD